MLGCVLDMTRCNAGRYNSSRNWGECLPRGAASRKQNRAGRLVLLVPWMYLFYPVVSPQGPLTCDSGGPLGTSWGGHAASAPHGVLSRCRLCGAGNGRGTCEVPRYLGRPLQPPKRTTYQYKAEWRYRWRRGTTSRAHPKVVGCFVMGGMTGDGDGCCRLLGSRMEGHGIVVMTCCTL